MLVQSTYTQGTTKELYDQLLSEGWFRGTGVIYKSDLLCMDEQVLSTVHIRLPLAHYHPKKRHRKLLRDNNKLFTFSIGQPSFDEEKENLYKQHFNRFKSFINQSLQELVTAGLEGTNFETYELCVYDRDKLIALSYFDCSANSTASIICVFDQSYLHNSLGIYTMLLEIGFTQSRGFGYYYPGYIMDTPSSFDYKLTLGPVEWLHPSKGWIEQPNEVYATTKAHTLREKMSELSHLITSAKVEYETRIYPFFTVSYVFWQHPDLLRYPIYYLLKDLTNWACSYDLESNQFVLFEVEQSIEFERNHLLNVSDDYMNGKVYEMRLMKTHSLKEYASARDLIRSVRSRIAHRKTHLTKSRNSTIGLNLLDQPHD